MRTYTRQRVNIIKRREGEPWIYSYADLVTNLLAFFMMLLVVMTSPKDVREDFLAGLQEYTAKVTGVGGGTPATGASIAEVRQVIDRYLTEAALTKQVAVTETRTGIELTFEGALVFASGTAEVTPIAGPVLERIAQLLAKLPARFVLDVEGHADARPITSASKYPSNWELSSARAGSVVRFLETHGLSSRRLRAIGYAATKPIDKHADSEANRRVVVKVNSRGDDQ